LVAYATGKDLQLQENGGRSIEIPGAREADCFATAQSGRGCQTIHDGHFAILHHQEATGKMLQPLF
jgi:hypothetical protein